MIGSITGIGCSLLAGLALAFAHNTRNLKTVIFVALAAVLLSLVKHLLKNRLKDLV